MRYKVAQAIGLNTDQEAAQVTVLIQDGNLFLAVLKVTADDAFTKGRQLLSDLESFYFEAEGDITKRLAATYEEAVQSLGSVDYHLLLASVFSKALYFINKGSHTVYLKRGSSLSSLEGIGPSGQLISGFLEEGDKVFFATESLVSFLGDESKQLLNLTPAEWEEEVADKIGAGNIEVSEDQPIGLAGLVLEVEPDEDLPIPKASSEAKIADNILSTLVPSRATFVSSLLGFLAKLPAWQKWNLPKGRVRLALALVLILVIVTGAGVKFYQNRLSEKEANFKALLSQAEDSFAQASQIKSLNPAEAQKKLEEAKQQIDQAIALKPSDRQATELKKRFEEEAVSISQSFKTELPLYLDLELIKKGFNANALSLSVGKLLLLDPTVKTLVSVDLAKKSHQVLAGENQLGDAQYASINGGFAFVYSKDKGILRVDIANQKVSQVAKTDKEWKEVLGIFGFASNVYLLDTNQIWKYVATSSGYSDKRAYLGKETKADFKDGLKMQIESSIYILKRGGEILRFTRGEADHFSLGGLDKGIKDPKSLFTSSDTENLYILDSGNGRVVAVSKTGEYQAQYSSDRFSTAADIVVEGVKKIYVLDGSKIYMMELK